MIEIETFENGKLVGSALINATPKESKAFGEYIKTQSECVPAAPLARIFLANYRKGLRYDSAKREWRDNQN